MEVRGAPGGRGSNRKLAGSDGVNSAAEAEETVARGGREGAQGGEEDDGAVWSIRGRLTFLLSSTHIGRYVAHVCQYLPAPLPNRVPVYRKVANSRRFLNVEFDLLDHRNPFSTPVRIACTKATAATVNSRETLSLHEALIPPTQSEADTQWWHANDDAGIFARPAAPRDEE